MVVQLVVCGTFCLMVAAAGGDIRVPDKMVVWSALVVTSLVASALGFFVRRMHNGTRLPRARP